MASPPISGSTSSTRGRSSPNDCDKSRRVSCTRDSASSPRLTTRAICWATSSSGVKGIDAVLFMRLFPRGAGPRNGKVLACILHVLSPGSVRQDTFSQFSDKRFRALARSPRPGVAGSSHRSSRCDAVQTATAGTASLCATPQFHFTKIMIETRIATGCRVGGRGGCPHPDMKCANRSVVAVAGRKQQCPDGSTREE
jgi:hypothetical protein